MNQRDLIDKILARYSGKFTGQSHLPTVLLATLLDVASVNTVFRELLQNADDAEARSVEIRFETAEFLSREKGVDLRLAESERGDLPDLKTAAVRCFMVLT